MGRDPSIQADIISTSTVVCSSLVQALTSRVALLIQCPEPTSITTITVHSGSSLPLDQMHHSTSTLPCTARLTWSVGVLQVGAILGRLYTACHALYRASILRDLLHQTPLSCRAYERNEEASRRHRLAVNLRLLSCVIIRHCDKHLPLRAFATRDHT